MKTLVVGKSSFVGVVVHLPNRSPLLTGHILDSLTAHGHLKLQGTQHAGFSSFVALAVHAKRKQRPNWTSDERTRLTGWLNYSDGDVFDRESEQKTPQNHRRRHKQNFLEKKKKKKKTVSFIEHSRLVLACVGQSTFLCRELCASATWYDLANKRRVERKLCFPFQLPNQYFPHFLRANSLFSPLLTPSLDHSMPHENAGWVCASHGWNFMRWIYPAPSIGLIWLAHKNQIKYNKMFRVCARVCGSSETQKIIIYRRKWLSWGSEPVGSPTLHRLRTNGATEKMRQTKFCRRKSFMFEFH